MKPQVNPTARAALSPTGTSEAEASVLQPVTKGASLGRQILLAVAVGVATGIGAIVFYWLLSVATDLFQCAFIGYESPPVGGEAAWPAFVRGPFRPWMFPIVTTLGGFLSGWFVYQFAPEAEGHGTDSAIESYHTRNGFVRGRVPFVKALASALMIGSGGSGGREGPIAQIGSGAGSWLGRTVCGGGPEQRILMAAGMGAGVGAIFRAPLAGALFAAEILYGSAELEPEVLVPAIVASITAYSLFGSVFGWNPLFAVGDLSFRDPRELLPYTGLALLVVVVGRSYVKGFYATHKLFQKLPGPLWLRPTLGGLATGLIASAVPGACGTGYGEVQAALRGQRAAGTLLGLAGLRIATTSFSIASGGSGGVFGPSMVIGGSLGGAAGAFFHAIWPRLVAEPDAYVIVGMAGFFAGISHAPISTLIMVSEMTGAYKLLVPAMWVCVVAFLGNRTVSIYVAQAANRRASPAHHDEFLFDSLDVLQVGEAMERDPHTVDGGHSLEQVREELLHASHRLYPVVDDAKHVIGVFDSNVLDFLPLRDSPLLARKPVKDFTRTDARKIRMDMPLREAASLLSGAGEAILLVTAGAGDDTLLGVLTPTDLLAAHEAELDRKLKKLREREEAASLL